MDLNSFFKLNSNWDTCNLVGPFRDLFQEAIHPHTSSFSGTFWGNFVWHQLLFPNGGKKPDSSWVKQNRQRSHCREKLHSLKRIIYIYALALSTVYAKGSKTVLKIFFLYLGKLYSFLNTAIHKLQLNSESMWSRRGIPFTQKTNDLLH